MAHLEKTSPTEKFIHEHPFITQIAYKLGLLQMFNLGPTGENATHTFQYSASRSIPDSYRMTKAEENTGCTAFIFEDDLAKSSRGEYKISTNHSNLSFLAGQAQGDAERHVLATYFRGDFEAALTDIYRIRAEAHPKPGEILAFLPSDLNLIEAKIHELIGIDLKTHNLEAARLALLDALLRYLGAYAMMINQDPHDMLRVYRQAHIEQPWSKLASPLSLSQQQLARKILELIHQTNLQPKIDEIGGRLEDSGITVGDL